MSAKTFKIRLLVGRSGFDGSHAPGDEIHVPEAEAVALIESGQAEPGDKMKGKYAELLERLEAELQEREAEEARILAIQKSDELKAEAQRLLTEAVKIRDVLIEDDPEYADEFAGIFHDLVVGEDGPQTDDKKTDAKNNDQGNKKDGK